MRPVLKRIVVNGLLTALLLGLIGLAFAELAGMWLAANPVGRAAPVVNPTPPAQESVTAALRYRVPVTMAVWGFLFVAVGEVVLHLWRGRRANRVAKTPTDEPNPNAAEQLLEELLRQVEASRESAPGGVKPEPTGADTPTAPSPSAPAAENNPVQHPASPG